MKELAKLFAVAVIAVAALFGHAQGASTVVALATPTPVPHGFLFTPTAGATPTPLSTGGGFFSFGSSPTPFPHHLGVGAWVNPGSANPTPSSIAALETYLGRTLDYSLHYDSFGSSFPSSAETADATAGRIPIISLGCGPSGGASNIRTGAEDSVLTTYASQIASYGHTVELRYCWEMNLSYRNTTAADFVAAWQHMHTIMAPIATNIRWYWCPGNGSNILNYYPGGAYVDDAGWDQYDIAGKGFQTIMQPTYASLSTVNKPFIVGETGAQARNDQGTFLTSSTVAIIKANFPKISAINYFDAVGTNYDYTLSPVGLAAFKTFALAAQ